MISDYVADEPGVPCGPLFLTEVSDTAIRLTWRPPDAGGEGDLVCYVVEARLIDKVDIKK
jgi:hypothetical protein